MYIIQNHGYKLIFNEQINVGIKYLSLDIAMNKDRSAATISLLTRLFSIVLLETILCNVKLFEMHLNLLCT